MSFFFPTLVEGFEYIDRRFLSPDLDASRKDRSLDYSIQCNLILTNNSVLSNSITAAHTIEWLCLKLYTALGSETLLSFDNN